MRYTLSFDSPLGPILLTAEDGALTGVYFGAQKYFPTLANSETTATPVLLQAKHELQEYFAGTRKTFGVPLAPKGSPFQQAVWRAIASVPFGATISYTELARRAGHEGSVRAVGAATGRNPIGIIIPCHRIVGADGSLTGYAGGLDKKRALLSLESALPRKTSRTRDNASLSLAF